MKTVFKLVFLAVIVTIAVCPAQAQFTTSGSDIYNTNSGNVGIGTSSPGVKLEVAGAIGSTGSNATVRSVGTGQTQFQIINTGSGTDSKISEIIDASGQITFRTVNDAYSAAQEYLRVFRNSSDYTINVVSFPNGNVGIGTTSPATKLDVNGDVTVSGNISARYQDLAEWVPAEHVLEPGTVVIQDPDGINTVIASNESYDTRVAGVISASPGIVLGVAGEGKVRVATTGRVKVHVDASRAPIRAGDLLVTGDKEGTAMRSEPIDVAGTKLHRPGTLIGKALEPLKEGEGEILVLLSLQ